MDAAPASTHGEGAPCQADHSYKRHADFDPPPRERLLRRMGRYALNAVLLVAAQLSANALLTLERIGQYLTPSAVDVLRSTIAMSLWWLWVCKTRPAVRAEMARQVPGSSEAAVLMLAQAAFAWVPQLLGARGTDLSIYWGTGPRLDSIIWIGLAACVMFGRPGMRDVAAFTCWFRIFILGVRSLLGLGAMSLGTWISPALMVAVAGTNFGLMLLLGGSPGRITRFLGVGIFLAALTIAVAMSLASPTPGQFPP